MNKYHVVFHLDEPSKGRADQVLRRLLRASSKLLACPVKLTRERIGSTC